MFYNRSNNNEKGYIGILVAVIVTLITMAIALTFSSSNFLGRFDTQYLETKDIGRSVAMGCLEYAKSKLSLGAYNGNETINVGSYQCNILPVESGAGIKIIKSTATVQNKTTNLKLTVNNATLNTISLEEVSSF